MADKVVYSLFLDTTHNLFIVQIRDEQDILAPLIAKAELLGVENPSRWRRMDRLLHPAEVGELIKFLSDERDEPKIVAIHFHSLESPNGFSRCPKTSNCAF